MDSLEEVMILLNLLLLDLIHAFIVDIGQSYIILTFFRTTLLSAAFFVENGPPLAIFDSSATATIIDCLRFAAGTCGYRCKRGALQFTLLSEPLTVELDEVVVLNLTETFLLIRVSDLDRGNATISTFNLNTFCLGCLRTFVYVDESFEDFRAYTNRLSILLLFILLHLLNVLFERIRIHLLNRTPFVALNSLPFKFLLHALLKYFAQHLLVLIVLCGMVATIGSFMRIVAL